MQQYLHACSSGIVWVETIASLPAAGAANPPLLSAIVSPIRGLQCVLRPQSGKWAPSLFLPYSFLIPFVSPVFLTSCAVLYSCSSIGLYAKAAHDLLSSFRGNSLNYLHWFSEIPSTPTTSSVDEQTTSIWRMHLEYGYILFCTCRMGLYIGNMLWALLYWHSKSTQCP